MANFNKPGKPIPDGQLRQSQILTTYGPGAMLDLPESSVLMGGLEFWSDGGQQIQEPRLIAKLKRILGVQDLHLRLPPVNNDFRKLGKIGIRGWIFPEWFVTREPIQWDGEYRLRRLVHRKNLLQKKYRDEFKKSHSVVPVRFVAACKKGHLGEVPWSRFVHRDKPCPGGDLWMAESGSSGDLSEIQIRCACGARRPFFEARKQDAFPMGMCEGRCPWLGTEAPREECREPKRLLIRHATNAYFTRIMSVISLPGLNESLEKAVNSVWASFLHTADGVEDIAYCRRKFPEVTAGLSGFTNEEVYSEVLSRKNPLEQSAAKSVKEVEFEVLAASSKEIGQEAPEGNFHARALDPNLWKGTILEGKLEKVVVINRLREVRALAGFTRFEPAGTDTDGELQLEVEFAPLSREANWLPAIENRGEGFFLLFSKERMEAWKNKTEVLKRELELKKGFDIWEKKQYQSNSNIEGKGFPSQGVAYYLLHSMAHMLIEEVSLECGYPISSIRERIYALEKGFGIMLYTSTPDAEGTMGGLAGIGRNIVSIIEKAIENGRLCSNDPVCAQHKPSNEIELRPLAGAACHGCLLISETSCEVFNDFLDRSLVVPTVESLGCEFFGDQGA